MLILICEVCTMPMKIPVHIERTLLGCKYVICANCKQASIVGDDIKSDIKKAWGMLNEQN